MEPAPTSYADKIGLVLLVAVGALVLWRLAAPPDVPPPVAVGTPMPPLKAAGWLNLPAGESFEPGGKVVVVDCWATYCVPCRREIPRLAEIAAQYGPLGVDFVGLTDEPEQAVPAIRAFIDDVPGFDWPVGYGATDFMRKLDIRVIPTVIVFGGDRKVRWSSIGAQGLEAALDAALAASGK